MFFIRLCYWIAVLFGVPGRIKRNYPYLLLPEKNIVDEVRKSSLEVACTDSKTGECVIFQVLNTETGDKYVYIKPTKEILLSVHWYKDMTFLERCVLTIFLYDEVLVHK
jgi:hypothetical protein